MLNSLEALPAQIGAPEYANQSIGIRTDNDAVDGSEALQSGGNFTALPNTSPLACGWRVMVPTTILPVFADINAHLQWACLGSQEFVLAQYGSD